MRVILDVSADAENHIKGTASWGSGRPIEFSGWLALMLLMEQANPSQSAGEPAELADRSGHTAAQAGPDP